MILLLDTIYPWAKALHIMAVISWMAGLFYLPRLFVHHVERAQVNDELDETFQMMEVKLQRIIMKPAMYVTWLCGVAMAVNPGLIDWSMLWPWFKSGAVISMTVFHFWTDRERQTLASGQGWRSGKYYRVMNEVPSVLMVVIVISVVIKF